MAEQSTGRGKPRRRTPENAPIGTVIQHPEGIGCTAAGVTYAADAEGKIRVPTHVVSDLQAHGFAVVN